MILTLRRLLASACGQATCAVGGLRRCCMLVLMALTAFVATQPLHAAGLQITPILLELGAREQAQSIFLSNSGNAALHAQIRVFAWTQTDGGDQLTPTQEVAASPPLLEVAPGAQQMVRIVRLLPAPADRERNYRLVIDELPGSDAGEQPPTAGLQFLLRYSIPLFVLPIPVERAGALAPASIKRAPAALGDVSQLSASVEVEGPRATALTVTNHGTRHAKLSHVAYVDAQGKPVMLVPGLLGYVLAGQAMHWMLNLPALAPSSGASLSAKFNDDQEAQLLPLAVDRP